MKRRVTAKRKKPPLVLRMENEDHHAAFCALARQELSIIKDDRGFALGVVGPSRTGFVILKRIGLYATSVNMGCGFLPASSRK